MSPMGLHLPVRAPRSSGPKATPRARPVIEGAARAFDPCRREPVASLVGLERDGNELAKDLLQAVSHVVHAGVPLTSREE